MAQEVARPWRGRQAIAGLMLLALSLCEVVFARVQDVSEASLKAAFVLNFARFVAWPEDHPAHAGAVVMCVGDAGVASALQAAVAGQPSHRIDVRLFAPAAPDGCTVAYLGRTDDKTLAALLPVLHAANILTVSDMPDFVRRGGMIHLYSKGGRMRFAINLRPFGLARLKPDVRLLTLADQILN
jgi:hypothetical protein